MKRIHLRREGFTYAALCGLAGPVLDVVDLVTCKVCLRKAAAKTQATGSVHPEEATPGSK